MSTFLTYSDSIDSFTIPVQTTGATQDQSDAVGDTERAFDGTLWTSIRSFKQNWAVETGPLLPVEEKALRTAIEADGAKIGFINGDMIQQIDSIEVYAEILSSDFITDGTVDGFLRIMKLRLRQA